VPAQDRTCGAHVSAATRVRAVGAHSTHASARLPGGARASSGASSDSKARRTGRAASRRGAIVLSRDTDGQAKRGIAPVIRASAGLHVCGRSGSATRTLPRTLRAERARREVRLEVRELAELVEARRVIARAPRRGARCVRARRPSRPRARPGCCGTCGACTARRRRTSASRATRPHMRASESALGAVVVQWAGRGRVSLRPQE
jgi:hypothetical protein